MHYKTIKQYEQDFFIEKKSKFIGHIKPVKTQQQAIDFVNQIKQKYFDARHNVYAYILDNGKIKKYSDDGEPQGTGGIPVLDVLQKENLTDVCVVITRYFGGIMLGGGGLVRAYSKGAKIAIDASEIVNMYLCDKLKINIDYNLFGKLNHILPKYNLKILKQDFNENIDIEFLIDNNDYNNFCNYIKDISNGQVEVLNLGQEFYNIKSL